VIWFVALFPTVVLFALLVWRELSHQREALVWVQERQILLDRIMAGNLTDFQLAQLMHQPAENTVLTDEMEAELERRMKTQKAE